MDLPLSNDVENMTIKKLYTNLYTFVDNLIKLLLCTNVENKSMEIKGGVKS